MRPWLAASARFLLATGLVKRRAVTNVPADLPRTPGAVRFLLATGLVKTRPVTHMPVDLLRTAGAFSYGAGWHPFLSALRNGPMALADFYDRFRPRTLSEFYFLDGDDSDDRLPLWSLPWAERLRPLPAEGGLGREHGVSYFGPCTPEKVALEYRRLTDLVSSIEAYGYMTYGGRIRGFVMRRGDDQRFFVRGGKHRAAVLAFLGAPTIPVTYAKGWPMVIDRKDAEEWPHVRAKRISPERAVAIFDRYFDFDGSQQAARLGIRWTA